MAVCAFILLSQSLWSQSASSKSIKVLTFNILHGATTKGDFDLDAIAKVINDVDPDLVALQEVDFRTNRAKKYDLVVEMAVRTKMVPLFGKAMAYDGGEYGEGILSKYSFIRTRNVPLPHSPGNEPRAALEVVVQLPSGDTVGLVGTHLDHLRDPVDRIAQAKEIKRVFSQNSYPTILAGDLNAVPGSEPMNILTGHWAVTDQNQPPAPTIPSDNPRKKIDYVMVHPADQWEVLDTQVICDAVASDHCAYLVTLKLLNKQR
jgi:endonuclease/exonuclease/phosphatase family metal-dependent hydrolase